MIAQVLAEWNVVYDAHNEVAGLMLGIESFDLIQTFHAYKQEEGKSVSSYVLKMKGYVEQLERLGYVLLQDLGVVLILNGLTGDFAGFVRNYNMHNIRKTIGELHVLLIEYEKGLPKKAATPQVMAIQGGGIQKANKKSLNAKGKGKRKGKGKDKSYIPKPKNPKPFAKEHPTKDDTCHHCKEVGHWKRNGLAYIAELIKKKNQEFKDYLKAYGIVQHLTPPYTPQHNTVSEKTNRTLLDMVRSMTNLITLALSFWDYALETATRILNMDLTKKVRGCEALVKKDTPDKLQQRSVKCIFVGYPKETMGYYFYFPPENKIVIARYAEFLEKNLLSQEISGRAEELEEIQDEDASPSKNTSEIPMKFEGFEPPQEEVVPVCRSARTHRAPERLCLNVEVEEHSLGDLKEPANYKATLLDPESDKWLDVMNAEMQSMDRIVHTYKACLVAKDLLKPSSLIMKKCSHLLLTLELLGFL
ncbi:retrotransposon protein, putative, ty1-copia subclass [Tanacetum coccineum]|uniref:Retrotransposon protein, putative, ty1-copia subclass n=1 Tax=Tanacetum coccineum TaxID=301880 RepID=A0ABQ4Y719_9ASTR